MASFHLATDLLTAIYDGIKSKIFLAVYPVGSVYLSWNSTDPKNLFGGTWTRLSGGFLYGCVSSVGTGNGTGTATNSHTLTIDEMPRHSHKYTMAYGNNDPASGFGYHTNNVGVFGSETSDNFIKMAGGSKGHTHNIPYIAVFAWRRTA